MGTMTTAQTVTFTPGLAAGDVSANYWMRQVMLRLRREVCWIWQMSQAMGTARLDALGESLELSRYWEQKQQFFRSDEAAGYLTRLIEASPAPFERSPRVGSFGWVVDQLKLDDLGAFVLALGLSASFDNAVLPAIAACLNQPSATAPTLALAQKLWDRREQFLSLADGAHPLPRFGLMQLAHPHRAEQWAVDWNAPLTVPPPVARCLLFPDDPLPLCLSRIAPAMDDGEDSLGVQLAASRIRERGTAGLRVVPVLGQSGTSGNDLLGRITRLTGRPIFAIPGEGAVSGSSAYLPAMAAVCWLRNADLYLQAVSVSGHRPDRGMIEESLLTIESLPITVFVPVSDVGGLAQLPRRLCLPAIEDPRLSYAGRVRCWTRALGDEAPRVAPLIEEYARRFRYERGAVESVCRTLMALGRPITAEDFATACRAEVRPDAGDLAQPVMPRFEAEELVLPEKQDRQFHEILRAMQSLTRVHYRWGTARVWNESGISVLFSGPPGTGKTMAAEVLASKLSLPMYRVDLSQVVNKYIGETEKNLKRVFDAADVSDCILFFDEADSLFGRRTETRDSHDRYANLETSYLLDRMERFKGLAILATNRKKDLDEAFMRRLRYTIDFPLPGPRQRRKIWTQSIPQGVDASGIEVDYLARAFPLAGGHIRSIVFNACLQSAHRDSGRRLEMEDVMIAVKRECDKMNRPLSRQQFGAYAAVLERVEHEDDQDRY